MIRCLALLAIMWGSGCYYDVDPLEDLGVEDLRAPAFDFNADAGLCPNGSTPVHAGELAEAPANGGDPGWGAAAVNGDAGTQASVTLDTARVAAGAASLRLDTTASEAGLFYPETRAASFDLSEQLYISFAVTGDNAAAKNDPGWQGGQPHLLVVTTSNDYFEYIPMDNHMPRSPAAFVGLTVPLSGGYGWTRNTNGSPDLRNVAYVAWTFTTWGTGFTAWLDDVQIGPAPFLDCP